jgi:OmpA-OmpF porin, OOP family
MRRVLARLGLVLLAVAVVAAWSPAHAQFGLRDKLKDKVKSKVEQRVDKKTDDAIDKGIDAADPTTAKPADKPAEPAEAKDAAEGATPAAAGPKGGTATAEDMSTVTKFDFIPGDKVIFFDDMASEELGEFPSRWKLDEGVFEIAKRGDRKWILCSDKGSIRPKVPAGPLPPKYTFEMDLLERKAGTWGDWYTIEWLDAKDEVLGEFSFGVETHTVLKINGKSLASKDIAEVPFGTVRTMRVMATTTTLKCYVDHERVANVPAVEGFQPVGFRVQVNPGGATADAPELLGTVRYAEGGKTLKQQLDEAGRIVTHGILFDSGSDKIKAESYKTLADIGGLLTDTPTLRLSIEGHTDSDGADPANLELSQKRAEAVKAYLGASYKIDAGRLETKGWGESKPIDTNDTAEGKANNRRVELVKL